ncbi:hypothetical protein GCM10009789_68990 [Kribbella sancticallisti]|uniref:Uncharacterized protein n=1 Tax=Kribbella sancticallisti TaxID=460087 RepID=A0ABN2EFX9_9ACTN
MAAPSAAPQTTQSMPGIARPHKEPALSPGSRMFIRPAGISTTATIDAGTIATAGRTRRPALNQIQRG